MYLIRSGEEALLFDSGNRPPAPFEAAATAPAIVARLERESVRLKYVLLSHFHFDHTGSAAFLRERYGAKVVAHRLERPLVEEPVRTTRSDFPRLFGVSARDLLADFNLRAGESLGPYADSEIFARCWNFPVPVDLEVEEGDVLEVGDLRLSIVHLPGHTPGHVGLWNPARRSLYVADLGNFPAPIHPHPIGDAEAHLRSIRKARALDAEYLFEGHFPAVWDSSAVRRRFDHLLEQQLDLETRLIAVLGRATNPATLGELVAETLPVKCTAWESYLLGNGTGGKRWVAAEACLQSHLRRLAARGDVERLNDGEAVRWRSRGA